MRSTFLKSFSPISDPRPHPGAQAFGFANTLQRFERSLATRPSLDELRALAVDKTRVLPPDAGALREPLIDAFHAAPTSGDALRCPPRTNLSGPEIRAAVQRLLSSADRAEHAFDPDGKVGRMLGVLRAVDEAITEIHHRSRVAL